MQAHQSSIKILHYWSFLLSYLLISTRKRLCRRTHDNPFLDCGLAARSYTVLQDYEVGTMTVEILKYQMAMYKLLNCHGFYGDTYSSSFIADMQFSENNFIFSRLPWTFNLSHLPRFKTRMHSSVYNLF